MKKIDTTSWRQFCIGDLFRVVKGKRLTKANMIAGKINYIGATAFNNGISASIGNSQYVHPAGVITVCYNGSIGQTFYQDKPFWASDDVNVLYPNFELTPHIAHFLCPIIYKVSQNYAYVDKWTVEKMRKTIIVLPSKNEEPDWQYMEDYMRQIELHAQSSISALRHAKYGYAQINTAYWKDFTMKDLGFENFHGQRLTKKERVEGNIPFITAGKENQGVVGKIGNGRATYHNAITVDMFGNVFYHKGEYAGDDNIYFFVNDKINELCKQFIVVSAHCQIRSTFEYKDQFRQGNADTLSVKLPSTPSGEPDWHYMEMYMRGVEAIVKNKLSLLVPHKSEVAIKDAANVTFNNATVTYIDQSKTYNVK